MLPFNPVCRCEDRQQAQRALEFIYVAHVGGWIFANGPLRTLTHRERWRGGFEDHTGEPYVWAHDCPFCGRALPNG